MKTDKTYIICSAIWYDNGKVYAHQPKNIESGIVVAGWRHHNCIIILSELFPEGEKREWIQGFLTNKGNFVNRKKAGEIAFESGQVKDDDILFSEDLY